MDFTKEARFESEVAQMRASSQWQSLKAERWEDIERVMDVMTEFITEGCYYNSKVWDEILIEMFGKLYN
jgi:hypothetical protein